MGISTLGKGKRERSDRAVWDWRVEVYAGQSDGEIKGRENENGESCRNLVRIRAMVDLEEGGNGASIWKKLAKTKAAERLSDQKRGWRARAAGNGEKRSQL